MGEAVLIRSMRMQVATEDGQRAMQLRNRLQESWVQQFAAALEETLGTLDLKGKTLVIPSLRFKAGAGADATNPDTWIKDIAAQFAEALYARLNQQAAVPGATDNGTPAVETAAATAAGDWWAATVEYLSSGNMPWWATHLNPPLLQQLQVYVAHQPALFWKRITQAAPQQGAAHNRGFWMRLLSLMQPQHTEALWEASVPDFFSLSYQEIKEVLRVLSRGGLRAERVEAAWFATMASYQWLSQDISVPQKNGGAAMVKLLLQWFALALGWHDPGIGLSENMPAKAFVLRECRKIAEALKNDLPSPVVDMLQQQLQKPDETGWQETYPQETGPLPNTEEAAVSWIVRHSGLVIFHPFLVYFFRDLGLCDGDNMFVSRQAQERAVYLLSCICGHADAAEWELALEKVLCGLYPADFVHRGESLTTEEARATAELTAAVLEYWTALKGSSAEALQETFLLRQGILRQKGQAWELTVEKKTVDVLLQQLPWGTGIIAFSWCDYPLYVDWT